MTAVTAFPGKLGHTSSWQVTEMFRLNENTRVKLMIIHGFAMLALGLSLFYVRATMTNLLFYVFGGAFALLLVAASLLFIAGVDWLCAAGLGRQQVSRLRGLLFLSTAVAACGVFLILYPGENIRMLCYVLAVYALSLSCGKIWSCQSLDRHQAATDGHVHPSGNCGRFQRRSGRICRPGRPRCSGCGCDLFVVHGLSDAAHHVFSSATAGAKAYRAFFSAQPGKRVRPFDLSKSRGQDIILR